MRYHYLETGEQIDKSTDQQDGGKYGWVNLSDNYLWIEGELFDSSIHNRVRRPSETGESCQTCN